MNFWRSAEGTVRLQLTGADTAATLEKLGDQGIRLTDVIPQDELTVSFTCSRRWLSAIKRICDKRGDKLSVQAEIGLYYRGISFLHRPVIAVWAAVLLGLTLWIPTRVWFFQVEGNEQVPSRRILETAGDCGIRFGVSRRAVRSEKMKNTLLEKMPELKWAGINTSGCTAVISVRERQRALQPAVSAGAGSMAAVRDGFITSCTATRGKLLCAPGQAVKKGQVLISGYNDLGICIQITGAEGEIYARTSHEFQAVTPSDCLVRGSRLGQKRRYSLILGKKRINFLKDSGISDTTCGRMYEEYYITLPGGFRLPVKVGVETLTFWSGNLREIAPEEVKPSMTAFAERTVLRQTVAGKILSGQTAVTSEEGRFLLTGRFFCEEMIGRFITEEIGETNGKTD